MQNYIENLQWRYATKKFDTTQKISKEKVDQLLEAIQLTASSYGLQPYEIIIVENPDLRKQLQEFAWNQPQITEASHLILFANHTSISQSYVDNYLNNIAETRGLNIEDLAGLEGMLKSTVLNYPAEDQNEWAAKQAYIALGNLLSASAEFKIDACPMEGFDAKKFDEILNLKAKGLTTAVVATLGYRSDQDATQFAKKVRKSKKDLFTTI